MSLLVCIFRDCMFQTGKTCCSQAVDMERQALQRAREAFLSGRTRPVEFRLQQLHGLQKMITDRETEISTALKQDINRVNGDTAHCCIEHREPLTTVEYKIVVV